MTRVTNEIHLASYLYSGGSEPFPVHYASRIGFSIHMTSPKTKKKKVSTVKKGWCRCQHFRGCKHHTACHLEWDIAQTCPITAQTAVCKLNTDGWLAATHNVLFDFTHLKMALVLSLPHLNPSALKQARKRETFLSVKWTTKLIRVLIQIYINTF